MNDPKPPSVSWSDPSVNEILEVLRYQTDKERFAIFEKLKLAYCFDCGKLQPSADFCKCPKTLE